MKKAAIAAIPWSKLAADEHGLASRIIRKTDVFRELPSVRCAASPEVYAYFTQHPDVAVGVWRAMGISSFAMSETAPGAFRADAGDGTVGAIRVLHQDVEHSVVACEGRFTSPVLRRPLKVSALLHLQARFARDKHGRTFVAHRAALFVWFPSAALGTAARVVSPLSNRIMDRNFEEISLFVHMMSQAMQRSPGWVERTTKKITGLPEARKAELLKLTARTFVAARKRETSGLSQSPHERLREVMRPLNVVPASAR